MTNPISFKAKPAAYKNNLILKIAVAILVAGLVYWRYGLLATLIFTAVVSVVIVLVLWIPLQRHFSITKKEVIYKGLFGHKTSIALKNITHAIYATAYYEPNFGTVSRILIADEMGKKLISLNGIYWDNDDLKRSADFLGKSVDLKVINDQITFSDLAKKYPIVMPYYEKHPFILGLVIAGVIVVVAAVAAVAAVLLTQ